MKRYAIPLVVVALVSLAPASWAAWFHRSSTSKTEKTSRVFFGNATDPISGQSVNRKLWVRYADPATHTYGKIYAASSKDLAQIRKDLAVAYKKAYLDREVRDEESKVVVEKGQPIPLHNTLCPVMGGKVDNKTYLIYNGYRVDFCCPGCDKTFMKDPDKSLQKLVKDQNLTGPGLPAASK